MPTWHNLEGELINPGINLRRDDFDLRVVAANLVDALRRGNETQKQYLALLHPFGQ